ncbi:hypothetical protein [Pseudomonas sp. dw_358]|uniref:hypothetical protein n=1 Tax=Pseudomonas sp. dw_358 TaxID=2720083 RepID=UPI001BD3FF66|nr:hypothetical protein [Pseudomonas sp. dw_358]
MVSQKFSSVEEIVCSQPYKTLLLDLVGVLSIKVDSGYEDIFIKLDTAKLERSGLSVEQVLNIINVDSGNIKKYSINKYYALNDVAVQQEYPAGQEPSEDDRDVEVSVGNYTRGFLLTNIIEYMLATEGLSALQDYIKLSRIPKAKIYARQVLSFLGN